MLQIERAVEADIPALLSLLQSLFAIEKDFVFDGQRQQRGLQALISALGDRSTLLVARVDGVVAGMASGQLVISTAEGAPSVWIEDVVVAQDERGKGIGRELLNAIVAWARSQGATRAQLLADRDNPAALSFYAHYGMDSTDLVALRLRDLDRPEYPKKTGAWEGARVRGWRGVTGVFFRGGKQLRRAGWRRGLLFPRLPAHATRSWRR